MMMPFVRRSRIRAQSSACVELGRRLSEVRADLYREQRRSVAYRHALDELGFGATVTDIDQTLDTDRSRHV